MTVSIIKAKNGYTLRRVESYGYYNTREDAEKVIVELENCNWDKSKLEEIRMNLGVSNKPKNYHVRNIRGKDKYIVTGSVGGRQGYYGIYNDEDTAKRIVEELRKVDWNKALLPRIKEKILGKGDD